MVFKSRNTRLSPKKVRANLLAQQDEFARETALNERLARASTLEDAVEEAQQEVVARITNVATDMHAKLKAVAKTTPAYRPLIGQDWKETLRLVKEYADTLPEAERKEFLGQFVEAIGRVGLDPLEFVGLVLLANYEHSKLALE